MQFFSERLDMNLQLPRRLLVAALIAAGAMSSAQAANYIEIDGANVKFFYDADFWGVGSASVTGNSISFSISDDFEVFAKSSTNTGSGAGGHVDYSQAGVFAVAKSGYSVSGAVGASATSTYSFTTGLGSSTTLLAGSIYGGAYSAGGFDAAYYEDDFYNSVTVYSNSNPAPGTGGTITAGAGTANNYYSAVGLDTQLGIGALQTGKGRTDTALTNVSYNFAVTAVPEPETYAMMIAGLGLVGFAARRRKNAA